MSIVRIIKCNTCDFTLLQGTGTALFVRKPAGFWRTLLGMKERKTLLPDPSAGNAPDLHKHIDAGRVGSSCAYFCRVCHKIFPLDSDDERKCRACKSADVQSAFEMVGQNCPKCNDGVFEDNRLGIT